MDGLSGCCMTILPHQSCLRPNRSALLKWSEKGRRTAFFVLKDDPDSALRVGQRETDHLFFSLPYDGPDRALWAVRSGWTVFFCRAVRWAAFLGGVFAPGRGASSAHDGPEPAGASYGFEASGNYRILPRIV